MILHEDLGDGRRALCFIFEVSIQSARAMQPKPSGKAIAHFLSSSRFEKC
jgi:hypothetical protein